MKALCLNLGVACHSLVCYPCPHFQWKITHPPPVSPSIHLGFYRAFDQLTGNHRCSITNSSSQLTMQDTVLGRSDDDKFTRHKFIHSALWRFSLLIPYKEPPIHSSVLTDHLLCARQILHTYHRTEIYSIEVLTSNKVNYGK